MGLFLPWAGAVFGTAAAVDTRGAVEDAGACVPCSIFVNWLASAFEFGAATGACPYFFPTLACLDGCPGLAAVWDQAKPEINNTAKRANFMDFLPRALQLKPTAIQIPPPKKAGVLARNLDKWHDLCKSQREVPGYLRLFLRAPRATCRT